MRPLPVRLSTIKMMYDETACAHPGREILMSYPPGPPGGETPESNDPNQPNPYPGPGPDEPANDPAAGQEQPGYGTPPPPPNPYDQAQYAQPHYGQPAYAQPAYGQPAYGQPQLGQPGYVPPTNGKATAALITGIVSVVLAFCCIGALSGIVAIILGIRARGEIQATNGQQGGDGMALAGIITGLVSILLGLAMLAVVVLAVANVDDNGYNGQIGELHSAGVLSQSCAGADSVTGTA